MATAEQTLREFQTAGLAETDSIVADLVDRELGRQRDQLELIASENFTWPAVLEAAGSVLTNKYAEGYPGKRYYGGCEWVDEIEQLAIDRAKQLFGAEHANVQPHAGAPANMAAYFALIQPGDADPRACGSTTAAISPTASRSTSRAASTTCTPTASAARTR